MELNQCWRGHGNVLTIKNVRVQAPRLVLRGAALQSGVSSANPAGSGCRARQMVCHRAEKIALGDFLFFCRNIKTTRILTISVVG